MRINENGKPNLSYLEKMLLNELKEFTEKKIFITQGFIYRNAFGEIDNLKRGDCLIILSCGAYGQLMASQYNLRSSVRSYYFNTIS